MFFKTISVLNKCGSSPCKNGGICTDNEIRFTCSCAKGFTGDTCIIGKYKMYMLIYEYQNLEVFKIFMYLVV